MFETPESTIKRIQSEIEVDSRYDDVEEVETFNISAVRKIDKWSKEDLAHESFYHFLKANNFVANSSSQYDFWMRSWNFYKQMSRK